MTIVIMGFVSFTQATEYDEFQWTEGVSGTLHRGENLTYKGYTVTVIGMPGPVESDKYNQVPSEPVEPFVGLNISKNGTFMNTTVLMQGGDFTLSDGELKVIVNQLPPKNSTVWLYESYNPYATIQLKPRGIAGLEVTVEANAQYTSSTATDIIATLSVKNPGTAYLLNVNVDVSTKLQIKRGDTDYYFDMIKPRETITKSMVFSIPMVAEKKSFEIAANATGYDTRDVLYKARGTKMINIIPEPVIIPTLKKTVNQKTYLKDNVMVSLTLKNNAKYELKNVSITDSTANNFNVVGNNSLHWAVNISAFGEWDAHYLIKPEVPNNGIDLPAASAEFTLNNEYYMIQSNRPKIVVYGPLIVLTKQSNAQDINPGDKVTITVEGVNTGSTPTNVIINDHLPLGMDVESGTTTKEEYLEAGKKVSVSYVIKIDSKDPVTLPPATAEFFELGMKGTKMKTSSSELTIRIKPVVTPAPVIDTPPAGSSGSTVEPEVTENNVAIPAPETPVIYEIPAGPQREKISSGKIDSVINLLLGCDASNNSAFTALACNFVRKIPAN